MPMTEAVALDEVVITRELETRPQRAPDHEGENQALGALAGAMAGAPDTVLQRLVEEAMALTRADSAGISLLEPGGENGSFRWVATAGAWTPYRDGTMPREESPCGEVVAREKVLLVREPERAFPALLQAEPGIGEGLLAPFQVDGAAAGTLWVIKHAQEGRFDAEDARLVESLARFAAAGWQTLQALAKSTLARRGTEQHLQLALDAAKMGTFTWYPQEDRTEPDGRTSELFGLGAGTNLSLENALATVIHPDDRQGYAQAAGRAIDPAGDGRFYQHFRIIRPDKSIRWIEINGETHFEGAPPRAMRMFGTVSDITEAKDAEERQAFLLRLSDALRAEPNAEAIANRSLRMLSEQMRLDRCYVGIYRLAEDLADFPYQAHDDRLPPMPAQVRLSDFPEALKIAFDRTMVIEDALTEKSFSDSDRASFGALQLRAVVTATLRKGERNPLWAIVAGSARARAWTQSEISLVEEVTERTWAAVERARGESALRASEEKYRSLFETMGQGYSLVENVRDESGKAVDQRYLELNPAVERLLGAKAEDAVGRLGSEVFPGIEKVWTETFDRVTRTGVPEHIENYNSGADRWFGVYVYPAGGDRFMTLYEDVTDRKRAELALHESEERQAFLLKLSDALRPIGDPLAAQGKATQLLGEHLRVNRVYYCEVDEDGDGATIAEGYLDGVASNAGHVRISDFGDAIGAEYRGGRLVVVADTMKDARPSAEQQDAYAAMSIAAYIGVPLVKEGRLVALLGLTQSQPREWTDAEIALTTEVAERTWAAVERARAEAALRESQERQAFLLKLSDALRAIADPLEIQTAAMHVLGEQLGIVGAQYYESDDDGEHFSSFGGYTDGSIAKVERVRLDDFGPFTKEAYRAGRTVVVDDVLNDDRITPEQAAAYEALGVYAYVGVPLIKAGRLVVALGAVDSGAKRWTKDEIALVEETAQRTWAAVERARAEAALRESEERFRGFAENSADVLWIVETRTMKLEYLSPAFESVWGEAREAVMEDLGRWANLVHPDDREQAAQGMPRLLAGETYTGTYRIVRPDGEVRWIRDTGFPIHEDGVTRVGGIAQDVTDLKAAEAAVSESEERYRLIVDNARDYAIIITDPEDIITDWLPGAEAVFGWTAEEAVGRPAAITFTPEDQAEGVPQREVETAAREGEAADVRWHQRKDGSHVFIEGMTTPLYNEGGGIRGYLKIGQDVSERRHAQEALEASERRMRSLATGIPQLVFRSLGDGHRIWGSPQWIEYTGISFEDSVGYGWVTGVHPEDREATLAAWADVEERGEYYCEHRIIHGATGEYRWHQTRATPLRDDAGRILEWLGTSTEVEELRGLQRRQALLLAELQHRVRNIIAMIRSVAERTSETAGTVEDYWQHLEGRISTMARTQGLLTREVGAGVDLQNLILDELNAQAAQPAQFTVTGPDVLLSAKAAEVLGLAIHELATNAVKYGALSAENGRIDIRWALLESEATPRLSLIWSEFGVRIDSAPMREGFGTELITERVPYELQGIGNMELRTSGLVATIEFPLTEAPSILQTDAMALGSMR